MSPEDVGIYLGGLWGQDPIIYNVSGTGLGFAGGMLVTKTQSQPSGCLPLVRRQISNEAIATSGC